MLTFLSRHQRSRKCIVAMGCLLFCCSDAGAQGRLPEAPILKGFPNIVFIMIDTLRGDHVNYAIPGDTYARTTTPNLYEFSKTAVVFPRAFSSSTWTVPCVASMLLSKHAFNHNNNEALSTDFGDTLPLFLKNYRYRLASIQTNELLTDVGAGFDYEAYNGEDREALVENPDPTRSADTKAVSTAIAWIDRYNPESGPMFLFMGLFSPHLPYLYRTADFDEFIADDLFRSPASMHLGVFQPDSTSAIRSDKVSDEAHAILGDPADGSVNYTDPRIYIAAYDAEIRYADRMVQLVLDKLSQRGLLDNSIIVIVADHGENMADQKPFFSHGTSLHLSQIHVPLLIHFPYQQSQLVVEDDVRTIDIFPTIFEYLGLSPSAQMDGRSLVPLIDGSTVDRTARPILSYQYTSCPTVRQGYSLIVDDSHLLESSDGASVL